MSNLKIIGIKMFCVLSILMILSCNISVNTDIEALGLVQTRSIEVVEQLSHGLFGDDKEIKSIQSLYNYNGNPDYIYVDFESWGYAVYFNSTLSLLEYSHQGSLPYPPNTEVMKYYAGPTNYFIAEGEWEEGKQFVHTVTGKSFFLSDADITMYSNEIHNYLLTNLQDDNILDEYPCDVYEEEFEDPHNDIMFKKSLLTKSGGGNIHANDFPWSNRTYITNYRYFVDPNGVYPADEITYGDN